MSAASAWWAARSWSLDHVGLHETNVPQDPRLAGFRMGGPPTKPPIHPTQTPAPSFAGAAPTSDTKETTVARHGGHAERHARRLEDLIAQIGAHLARAERRQRLYRALEHEATLEIRDLDQMMAELRESRQQRHPSGLAVAS